MSREHNISPAHTMLNMKVTTSPNSSLIKVDQDLS